MRRTCNWRISHHVNPGGSDPGKFSSIADTVTPAGEHQLRRPPMGFDSTFTGRGPQGAFGSGGHQEIYCAYDNAQVSNTCTNNLHKYDTKRMSSSLVAAAIELQHVYA